MVSTTRYPSTAPTAARPMPVFPEVGSTNTDPGESFPSCSARRIIHKATRSFTLPAGFKYSSLHSSRPESPRAAPKREASSSGVPPTSSVKSRTKRPISAASFFGKSFSYTIPGPGNSVKGKAPWAGCEKATSFPKDFRHFRPQKKPEHSLPNTGIYGIMGRYAVERGHKGAFLL